jgi:hypothetical protein
MTNRAIRLTVDINPGPEADAEELAELTRQLRTELRQLDVESVDLAHTQDIPVGAKPGDAIVWGTLLVTLATSSGMLKTLVDMVQSWLAYRKGRSVTLEIDGDKLEVQGISSREQRRLIDEWLSRHPEFVITR